MIMDIRKQQREQSSIHGQTEMVHPHRQCGEEDATAPLQLQEAEEIWLVT
jgi:hypothetical protein